jgi:hypothetical protein
VNSRNPTVSSSVVADPDSEALYYGAGVLGPLYSNPETTSRGCAVWKIIDFETFGVIRWSVTYAGNPGDTGQACSVWSLAMGKNKIYVGGSATYDENDDYTGESEVGGIDREVRWIGLD